MEDVLVDSTRISTLATVTDGLASEVTYIYVSKSDTLVQFHPPEGVESVAYDPQPSVPSFVGVPNSSPVEGPPSV